MQRIDLTVLSCVLSLSVRLATIELALKFLELKLKFSFPSRIYTFHRIR